MALISIYYAAIVVNLGEGLSRGCIRTVYPYQSGTATQERLFGIYTSSSFEGCLLLIMHIAISNSAELIDQKEILAWS